MHSAGKIAPKTCNFSVGDIYFPFIKKFQQYA